MEKTLNGRKVYEAPDVRPVAETPHGVAAREPVAARGDPSRPQAEGRSRYVRKTGYGVVALVLVVLGAMLATTQNRLGGARDEIASLERDVAATEAAATDAARSAAVDVAALEDRVTELSATLTTAEAELAGAAVSLTEARSDSTRLEGEVADLGQQVEAAESIVAATHGDVTKLDALTAFEIAWWTWGTMPDDFEWFEAQGIDIDQMDEAIRSLGLAADWETWAGMNFFVAIRVMGNFIDTIDDPALTTAWDAWIECDTMDGCGKATVELDGALTIAITTTMASLRAAAGASRAEM